MSEHPDQVSASTIATTPAPLVESRIIEAEVIDRERAHIQAAKWFTVAFLAVIGVLGLAGVGLVFWLGINLISRTVTS